MSQAMLSRVQVYLAQRRALGFQLKVEGGMLLNFARYADSRQHRGPLTRQLAMEWACSGKSTSNFYRAKRLEVLRVFAQHSLLTEPRTQLPPRHLFGPVFRRTTPHIYRALQKSLRM